MSKIRVLCVDDSALVRGLMKEIINGQPDMEVVAVAPDPLVARDLIKQHNPDVLTLDVEMPRMDGLDFLERLMRLRPMPVVMVSSLTQRNSEVTIRALELGAVDFVTKPKLGLRDGLVEYSDLIAEKIRVAAKSRPKPRPAADKGDAPRRLSPVFSTTEKLIAIGASTGGTEAIRQVLMPMPANSPAILITQHMPAGFTRSFVQRLDNICAVSVHEAQDGERILPGHVYLAPGGVAHMKLARSGANYVVHLEETEPVNRHRPSVDVLFQSVAEVAGKNAVGALLTGMGKDGAQGMLAMRQAGATTFAQDEASCVVFGMPREALLIGATDQAVPLLKMSETLLSSAGAYGHRV
ncbi:MAG TPA: chemotaxis response regulator protein-glutamate methylesterase [Pusillimonas sp.]|jgi:two-component system chemotaxis response regulator CheB|nr:chemotaxis response regulator protein-glutamate methylesterase [Pusillimonas sp.]MBC41940.1 chemotaxis response regulator protein-glutamate methylesterase [Pusillimonas sp.]HBT31452.1 chemotaxis response regulator protein-glutamate methylesterase [Pusillimonas sp.]HCN70229.1 chemotaxis response regulator protein-glutamate methylesterase [Pusillimonas sp.]HCP79649.1 chemotaxis response regulator protein-glutamate methylesterase [Pusillimonas sp.]|tara:strand:+ start:199230 stop:200285 length:1056 start_codon:yes stop_codon:yes gene_type:complete